MRSKKTLPRNRGTNANKCAYNYFQIMEDNYFIDQFLGNGSPNGPLPSEVMAEYNRYYPTPESRQILLRLESTQKKATCAQRFKKPAVSCTECTQFQIAEPPIEFHHDKATAPTPRLFVECSGTMASKCWYNYSSGKQCCKYKYKRYLPPPVLL